MDFHEPVQQFIDILDGAVYMNNIIPHNYINLYRNIGKSYLNIIEIYLQHIFIFILYFILYYPFLFIGLFSLTKLN